MPKKPAAKKASTWRDLNSDGGKKRRKIPLSLRAKLRAAWLWLRAVLAFAALGGLGYGAYFLYQNAFIEDILGSKGAQIKRIEFKTDGLATAEWLKGRLKISPDTRLGEVNIFALKSALESLSQIESASVERAYPDALKITLTELKPFMKLFADVSGRRKIFIMSPDGRFFEPSCVPPEMIDAMPKLEGWTPRFDGPVPQPCRFAPEIARFLGAAYAAMPDAARGWKRIDVSELGSLTLPLLKVSDASGMEIIFAPRDYKKQFDRLEYILRYQKENPLTEIKRIDLSIKGWAPVKIKTTK